MNFSNITLFALRILSNTLIDHVQIIRFFVHEDKICPFLPTFLI